MALDWLITQVDQSIGHWSELAGYLASALVFLTFCMKTIIPLRLLAIASNVAFIVYAAAAGLMPVLLLHATLLPLNILRTIQQIYLFRRVRHASISSAKIEALMPFMKSKTYPKDTLLFRKGDAALKMSFLHKGRVLVPEIGKYLQPGALFGEIGLFTPESTRTASAICTEDCEIYEISDHDIMQLCLQDSAFGLFSTKLIVARMSDNLTQSETCIFPAMKSAELTCYNAEKN
jgi:CRP/FNR family cyclic AMP-dependent transcriptional regulator